jgi:hypothetical protein
MKDAGLVVGLGRGSSGRVTKLSSKHYGESLVAGSTYR